MTVNLRTLTREKREVPMTRFLMPVTTLTTLNLKKTAFTLLCCTLLMLVLAGAPTAVAQSPSFSDFSSTANLTLNGSAAPANNGTANVLRLTPAAPSQAGSAWFNFQQPVAGGFTTVFKFQFTAASAPPADGIAFVIQNSSLTALGQGGGSIGYADGGGDCDGTPCDTGGGIPNSLAVEFDTYNNGSATDDPNANHIAVQSCGVIEGTPRNNSPAHGTPNDFNFPDCLIGTVASPSTVMSDGAVHTVTIDYSPAFNCGGDSCPGTLTVNLDGTVVLTTSVTIENELNLNAGGNAWVGFTSGTGTFFENHDILSWTFTPHTSTTVSGIDIPPGTTGVFSFGSFNYKVQNTTTGDMNVSITAIPEPSGTTFPPNFPTAQCIVYDGTGGNCWEFEAKCNSGTCESADFPLSTSYDATGPFPGPGFLKGPTLPCSTTTFTTNQITEFLVQRQDPTTKGTSGGGISCWVATKNTPPRYVAAVQQPINSDGSSIFNAKKGVVPVKFTLTDNGNATCSLPPATIVVKRTAGGSTQGTIDESLYTMAADNGSNFRISGCQYIYNLAAAALGPGTYEVDIFVFGSQVGSATFGLK
jgi:Bacterial lectin